MCVTLRFGPKREYVHEVTRGAREQMIVQEYHVEPRGLGKMPIERSNRFPTSCAVDRGTLLHVYTAPVPPRTA